MRIPIFAIGFGIATSLLATACRDNQDPQGAEELWARVSTSGYRSWQKPARYPKREPSFTLHGGSVDVFLNPTLVAARAAKNAPAALPIGSMVVKDGYSGNSESLSIVAVMEKRSDGWYFAEYSADGEALFSGKPKVCVDCHAARKDYSDWLFTVEVSP